MLSFHRAVLKSDNDGTGTVSKNFEKCCPCGILAGE
jgi:hypothetical protein